MQQTRANRDALVLGLHYGLSGEGWSGCDLLVASDTTGLLASWLVEPCLHIALPVLAELADRMDLVIVLHSLSRTLIVRFAPLNVPHRPCAADMQVLPRKISQPFCGAIHRHRGQTDAVVSSHPDGTLCAVIAVFIKMLYPEHPRGPRTQRTCGTKRWQEQSTLVLRHIYSPPI